MVFPWFSHGFPWFSHGFRLPNISRSASVRDGLINLASPRCPQASSGDWTPDFFKYLEAKWELQPLGLQENRTRNRIRRRLHAYACVYVYVYVCIYIYIYMYYWHIEKLLFSQCLQTLVAQQSDFESFDPNILDRFTWTDSCRCRCQEHRRNMPFIGVWINLIPSNLGWLHGSKICCEPWGRKMEWWMDR